MLLGAVVVALLAASVVTVRAVSSNSSAAPPPCEGPVTTLNVGADPVAVPWLTALARSYTQAERKVDGQCVVAQVRPLTLSQAQQALQPVPFPGAGTPPDVWVPESTTAAGLVRARPENARVLRVAGTPIASSPVVFAAPADAIRALAAKAPPNRTFQLSDLVKLARDPRGWGQPGIDRPDWGPIRFAWVDPATTALGASLVVAAVGGLTGTPPTQVRAATFTSTPAKLGMLSLVHAFDKAPATTTALLAPVAKATTTAEVMEKVGVLALYEQDVWRYNGDSPAVQLQATYPLGGQLAADYPFIVPQATWVDAGARSATADFRGWLLSPEVQARLGAYGLRKTDGTAGPELTAADRALSADPTPPVPPRAADGVTAARTGWRLLNKRVSLLGLFDVSGSMAEPVPGTNQSRLDVARSAAQTALAFFDERDALGLWEFSRELDGPKDYRVLVPLGIAARPVNGFPDRRTASIAAYRAMVPRTATGLYDSILAAYRSTLANYRDGYVNTLVVITDGKNEDPGSITLPALLTELKKRYDPRRPVHIVTLAYGTGADPASLAQVAKATDGLQFSSPDPRNISEVFFTAVAALAG